MAQQGIVMGRVGGRGERGGTHVAFASGEKVRHSCRGDEVTFTSVRVDGLASESLSGAEITPLRFSRRHAHASSASSLTSCQSSAYCRLSRSTSTRPH